VVVLKETGQSGEAIARRLSMAPATVATLYARAKAKGYEVVIVLDGDPLALSDPSEEQEDPDA
jgi:biotin operon repressor